MTTHRIGDSVEFKPSAGLGGWRPGTVTGFVGKLIEVTDWPSRRTVHALKPSLVRKPRCIEAKPDRGAQQAEARAQHAESVNASGPLLPIPRDTKPVRLQKAEAIVRAMTPRPKRIKPTRSQEYKSWLMGRPCAVTGGKAEEAHHYTSKAVSRGMGEKVSDLYGVPVTQAVHAEWHATGAVEACAVHTIESRERLATKVVFLEAALTSLVDWIESRKEGET